MTSQMVIQTRNLTRRFAGRPALDDLTLDVAAGGVHALVGRNGAGKSTLFRLLLGFLAPSAGSSRVLGHDSFALPPVVRGRVGCVDESHPLPAWMRVGELEAMQRRLHPGWSDATFREIASLFQLPGEKRVGQLSRGERAGLSLALAVAPGPELLLLDEPTLGLDVVASRAFLEALLFAGQRELGTIFYSSHQMAEVERLADRVLVLDRGALVADASPDELRARVSGWLVEEWPGAQPAQTIPELLDARLLDGTWELLVLDGDDVPARLAAQGARGVSAMPVGFARAMDALLHGRAGAASRRAE